MHSTYCVLKRLTIDDLAFNYGLEEAKKILENFSKSKIYNDINQIINLSIAVYYLDIAEKYNCWDKETIEKFKILKLSINKKIGFFFSKLNDSNISSYYNLLERIYIEEFWALIEKYKVYKKINFFSIENILKKRNLH